MKPGVVSRVMLLFVGGLVSVAVAQAPSGPGSVASGARQPLDPEAYARVLAKVLPKEGYTLPIPWGDLGPKLVQRGVIDLEKFTRLYQKDTALRPYLAFLEAPSEALITITTENASFLVNVFWGVGLANRNPLLEQLAVTRPERELMGLASTSGWTLGAKPVTELYSNVDLIPLTPDQQALVADLARSIYRPCCQNPTAFPDCNHGIALLGVIELMAANGFSREEILKAARTFNAFWFPEHYVQTGLLFQLQGIDWDAADPQEVLGPRFSSLRGWAQHVEQELQKLAHLLPRQGGGASCGVSP
jgi:hypothetical protein